MRKVDIRTLRKWRHYVAHAKKFRTRKKYKRKWTEHLRRLLSQSGPKYIPERVETPVVTSKFGGWWARTPYSQKQFLYTETQLAGFGLEEERRKREMEKGYCGRPEWADEEGCPMDNPNEEMKDCTGCAWHKETEGQE